MNNNSKNVFPKPIIKWVGGKTQILDKLLNNFPNSINNYHEIFLGGGSVLIALLSLSKNGLIKINGKIFAYDLNEQLISVYKNIQSNHNELFIKIQQLINEYKECGSGEINRNPTNLEEAKQSKENYYYWVRKQYNRMTTTEKNSTSGSAIFIFLNKTGFRGLFRTGPNGFNVPYGHYKNPEIINKQHLDEIHKLIQDVYFECCDFSKSIQNIQENDFVYLDPPYAPETTKSFVGYTDDGFDTEKHEQLFKLCSQMNSEKKQFIMSNADVSLVRDNFEEKTYKIASITCKRTINSKNPESKTKEVIIMNF
jgi:DNA adenine methylase